MRRRGGSLALAIATAISLVVVSCLGECGDDGPCAPAFHEGDRLDVKLSPADPASQPHNACLSSAGLEYGTTIVVTMTTTIDTLSGCTGSLVDLEIPDYSLTHREIPNDQRTIGADFDAVYKGVCTGTLRFDFAINGNVTTLPIRADGGAPDAIRALITVTLSGSGPECSQANCTTTFNVDIDRAAPRDTSEDAGDGQ